MMIKNTTEHPTVTNNAIMVIALLAGNAGTNKGVGRNKNITSQQTPVLADDR